MMSPPDVWSVFMICLHRFNCSVLLLLFGFPIVGDSKWQFPIGSPLLWLVGWLLEWLHLDCQQSSSHCCAAKRVELFVSCWYGFMDYHCHKIFAVSLSEKIVLS